MISNSDLEKGQKAMQGIEAGQNNLSPEEWSAFVKLKANCMNGNVESSESGSHILILKNALPRHSTQRLLQVHLKNFIDFCEKYFQVQTPIANTTARPSRTANSNTDKSKKGSNKTLILTIAALVIGYLVYSHWDTAREMIGIKSPRIDITHVDNKIDSTTNLQATIQQTTPDSAQQPSNVSGPITTIITSWTKFTNSFTYGNNSRYVISYTDGNLYLRGNNKDTLILKSIKEIYESGSSFFAVKNDGSLWAWGDNSGGQLGDNTGINKTTPIKVMDNVRDFYAVNGSYFAIKEDNSLWAWGNNQGGQLGVGDSENKYEPAKTMFEDVSFISGNSTPLIITLSGNEYYSLKGKPNLSGKHDYNFYLNERENYFFVCKYKLTPDGKLYEENGILASNVSFVGGSSSKGYSYITKNGDLYSWGAAPIGDGTNIPRKNPVLVLQNVIQYDPNNRYALSIDGKLYTIDTKNTFKYEAIASNVYLLTGNGYYTNDGALCTYDGNVVIKDIALPKIKYEIKPPKEQTPPPSQTSVTANFDESSISSALSTRLLSEEDLSGLSKQELRILRNEIYARHGYIFKSQDLRNYFSAKDWYRPQYNDVSNLLNTTEKKNVIFIQRHE